MKYSKCSVPGCDSIRQDVLLHKFPKCEKRLQQWLNSINCEALSGLSVAEVSRLQVCHKHFEQQFVTENSRILGTAYPTLFSPEEIATGIPTQSPKDAVIPDPSSEHSYSRTRHYDHTYYKLQGQQSSTSVSVILSACSLSRFLQHPQDMNRVQGTAPSTSQVCVSDELHGVAVTPLFSPKRGNFTTLAPNHPEGTASLLPQMQESQKKRKLVQAVETLTPKCKQLYKEYRKSRKLLSFTKRAKRALRMSKEHSFEEKISEMNPLARKVLLMQVRLCAKKIKGRRFTLEEKLIALTIMKQSPKAYKFLQRIFILPSMTTLKKVVQKLNVEPGINPQIFLSIKEEVDTWKEEKKYCSIIFDEMALEPGLTYTHKDKMVGFVDLTTRTNEFADHALVFMIKGVIHKWQQTIAFYFCQGATPGFEMKKILKEIVSAVGHTGLLPVALIADQGAAFQSAIKNLQEDTRRDQILADENTDDTIQLDGFKLSVIADPPHLIKGIRNNFLTKEVSFEGKRATWMDIVDVYKTDCQHANTRLLHKLNDEHVVPEKIKKMKVKNCVRVFSKTMAGALFYTSAFSHYADGRPVSNTLKNTAEVVSFLDDLFDSVNGASCFNHKSRGKELRSAVTASSKHHDFWRQAIQRLDNFKFINDRGQETTVPSIKNWVTTLKSFQRLWHFFSNKGIKIMRPRYLNSDAVENYFGQVRAYNFRNVNPDCHTFVNTFKSLLLTGFIKFHHDSFNCEEDSGTQLVKIKSLFKSLTQPSAYEVNKPYDELNKSLSQVSSCLVEESVIEARQERLSVHARAYTAGWIIRKISKGNNCKDCKSNLTVSEENDTHMWITQREYKTIKKRKLTYPSEYAVRCFGAIIQESNMYLEYNAHKINVAEEIKKEVLNKYDIQTIGCPIHQNSVRNAFLQISIKLAVYNWTNVINRILKGVDIIRLERRTNLPPMQKQALDKYKKRFKKK